MCSRQSHPPGLPNLKLILAIVFILATLCIVPFLAAEELPALAAPPDGCVRIYVVDKDGCSAGSGGFIGPKLIVTAEHVVKDRKSEDVEVLFPSWELVAGRVAHTDKTLDLAFIVLNDHPKTAEPFVLGSLTDELSVNGYGYGPYKQSWGKLSDTRWGGDSYKWNSVEGASARSGDSGGPILNADEAYVGTLWGSVDGNTYFTPVAKVVEIALKETLLVAPNDPLGPNIPPNDLY